MRFRPVIVAFILSCGGSLLESGVQGADEPPATKPVPTMRTLPGVRPSGEILLPNQWSLRPAGRQVPLGNFPVNMALHPDGQWLAVLHAGYGEHEIVLFHLRRQKIASRVTLPQTFYGLCFSPDGKQLFASGAEHEVIHVFDFNDGLLARHREIPLVPAEETTFLPAGLTITPKGKVLCVAGCWGHAVCLVPLDTPDQRTLIRLAKASFPYACTLDREGKRLFVSLWNQAAVAVIDLETKKLSTTWPTEPHPTEMALVPDGKTLFIACANSTKVSVLDTSSGRARETIACALYPSAPEGNTPNSLALTPDGQMLFVANADANNLAVFNVSEPGQARPLGFIPVGWYPTSVRFNPANKRLYVANGKGTMSLANPQGPNPLLPNRTVRQYIGGLFQGSLGIMDLPTPAAMAAFSKQAYQCSPLRRPGNDRRTARGQPDPRPARRRQSHQALPLRHQGEPDL